MQALLKSSGAEQRPGLDAARLERAPAELDITVVVPIAERHDDLAELHRAFSREIEKITCRYEFIFVIDGGFEEAYRTIRSLKENDPRIRIVKFAGRFGESVALAKGFEKARGDIIVTLSAYFQVEASEIHKAYRAINEGIDLVLMRRHPRRDSLFNRIQSAVFHWLAWRLIGSPFRDISCGFRAMRRYVAESLVLYGDLHRFLPAIALKQGFRVKELEARQSALDTSIRVRGLETYALRLLDLATLFFLLRFTTRPLRFFGLAGSLLLIPGAAICAWLSAWKLLGHPIAGRAFVFILGVLLVAIGIQTVLLGLIGEIIIFTHAREAEEHAAFEVLE